MAAIVNKLTKTGTKVYTKLRPLVMEKVVPTGMTVFRYAKVELKPPLPSEWGVAAAEAASFARSIRTGSFLQQTTTEALVTLGICTDVALCFFLGEIIGRGFWVVGYPIEGAQLDYTALQEHKRKKQC